MSRSDCVYCDRPSAHGDMLCQEHARSVDNARAEAVAEGGDVEQLRAEVARLTSQLAEALDGRERMLGVELLRRGGEWLGAARNWLKWKTRNGERVTWGSHDVIEPALTVAMVEDLAAEVAAAAMRPQPTEVLMSSHLRARWEAERRATAAEARVKEVERTLIDVRMLASTALAYGEEGWAYASDFFRKKWRADERSDLLRALLGLAPLGAIFEHDVERLRELRAALEAKAGGP